MKWDFLLDKTTNYEKDSDSHGDHSGRSVGHEHL